MKYLKDFYEIFETLLSGSPSKIVSIIIDLSGVSFFSLNFEV